MHNSMLYKTLEIDLANNDKFAKYDEFSLNV